jgi:hypothetical protein
MAKSLEQLRQSLMTQFPGKTITQSYLRLERNLNGITTSTNYSFDILQTDSANGTVSALEKRLNTSDVFCATAMCMYIYKAGTSATTVTDLERANATLNTFPNALVYTTAGEAAALQVLYQGAIRHAVNRVIYHDFDLDTERFYRVGQAQRGVIGGTGGTATNASQWDDANYGFIGLEPTISFGGLSQNEISIKLPAATSLAGTSSSNYLVLYYRGFKIQGAAAEFQMRNI